MYIHNDTCACIIIHVCLTLLASFFLPCHLSLKHVYGCKSIYALGFSQYLLRGFSTTISMSRHIYNYQTVSQYCSIIIYMYIAMTFGHPVFLLMIAKLLLCIYVCMFVLIQVSFCPQYARVAVLGSLNCHVYSCLVFAQFGSSVGTRRCQ